MNEVEKLKIIRKEYLNEMKKTTDLNKQYRLSKLIMGVDREIAELSGGDRRNSVRV